MLGGRGAGKTRAGAEWVNGEVAGGRAGRIALVGETLGDAREVMIDGPSGLRTIARADDRPRYEVTRRRLLWPNGAVAHVFSAGEPESLRGPQFDAAWGD
ncbi:MAG: terminase family protein, partial [Alphaproteobacteria bacterium]